MDKKYTMNGEWIEASGAVRKVGLSALNAEELGDVTYIGSPLPGTQVAKGGAILSLEAAKAALDLYAPLSGEIMEVNPLLATDPGLITRDPLGAGWIVSLRIEPQEESELLSEKDFLRGRGAGNA